MFVVKQFFPKNPLFSKIRENDMFGNVSRETLSLKRRICDKQAKVTSCKENDRNQSLDLSPSEPGGRT
jgi:hypothetical protein